MFFDDVIQPNGLIVKEMKGIEHNSVSLKMKIKTSQKSFKYFF